MLERAYGDPDLVKLENQIEEGKQNYQLMQVRGLDW